MSTSSPDKNGFGTELDGAVYEAAVSIVSRKRAIQKWRVAGFVLALGLTAAVSYQIYSAFQEWF